MRTALCCAVLAFMWPSTVARAQPVNLTEAEAVARLSASSPRALAARSAVEVARADVLSAGRWPNPRFTYDRETVAGVTEQMFLVAQPLPITGRRGLEAQAASASVEATSSRADEEIRRLRVDLRAAFADLLVAQTRERQLTTARDRLHEVAETLARREAAGDAAGFDRIRAEREVVDVETDRAQAVADRVRAQAVLSSFFDRQSDASQLVAVGSPVGSIEIPSLEALVQRAESVRGELIALRHEAEAAALAERASDRRRFPEPEVVVGTKSSNVGGGDVGSGLMLHASIPIFDTGKPERTLAAARAVQADARAAAFRTVLRGQIAAARAVLVERRALADRYRAQAVASADQLERIAQVSYEAGERTILELLDAYRSGLSARVRQATLEASVRQAEIELEYLSGWEMR